jgi:hypothetical protein
MQMSKIVARFEFDNCAKCFKCVGKVTSEGYVYKCADREHVNFNERWNAMPVIETTPGPVTRIEIPDWCPHRLVKISEK